MALSPISAAASAKVWYLIAVLANGSEEGSAPMTEAQCATRAIYHEGLISRGDSYRVVDGVYWRVEYVWCRPAGGGDELVGP